MSRSGRKTRRCSETLRSLRSLVEFGARRVEFGVALSAFAWIVAACAGGENIVVVPADQAPEGGLAPVVRQDASACQDQCSADLHSRVCGDDIVSTCPPEQGCGKAGCIAPCDAAIENQSSIGCEYFALRMSTQHLTGGAVPADGDCFAVAIVNTWTLPVSISVDRAGQSFDPTGFARIPSGKGRDLTLTPLPDGKLPPGEVAILFLAHNAGGQSKALCPVTPAVSNGEIASAASGFRGEAFRVRTSAPVVAYDFLPWGAGYASQLSASLLLPSSVWGFEHIAVDGYRYPTTSELLPERPGDGLTAIVARENDTEVVIRPSTDLSIGGQSVAAGKSLALKLRRGEFLQIVAAMDAPLAGSLITSDKPVGVWGGSNGLTVDEFKWCVFEAAHQQLPPIRAMGSEYVAVRFRNRYDGVEESPPWRIVAAVPGTKLTYVPSPPPGAPITISTGDVVDFKSPGGFIVKSQDDEHPFYMATYMEASPAFACSTEGRGGPEFVNVVATGQYLNAYRFFTDPSFSETNLVVIRRRKGDSFRDVVLDCAGPLAGWTPIAMPGAPADYEYTRVDLSRGAFEAQGQCVNGAHEMHSDAPFTVTVWGWSTEAAATPSPPYPSAFPYNYRISYAFAAGMGARKLNVAGLPPVVK